MTKREILIALASLLQEHRVAIENANTLDTGTAIATNRDNLDRGIATIRGYAAMSDEKEAFESTGVAIYSCYGDPSFGLFGMTLAPALAACGVGKPIIIGFPSILCQYKLVVEEIFQTSKLFRNVSFTIGRKDFCNSIESEDAISDVIVFGDAWIQQCMPKAIAQKKNLIFYGPGNNASVITASADLRMAVKSTLESAFILNGQAAVCINRVIVDDAIDRNELKNIFVEELAKITFGNDPFDENNYVTPIKIAPIVKMVQEMVAEAVDHNAELINYAVIAEEQRFLIQPSLVWDCSTSVKLFNQYNFSPVLPVCFASRDEIIEQLAASDYGIYNAFWGDDEQMKVLRQSANDQHLKGYINAGLLDEITTTNGYVGPWGGYNYSGFIINEHTQWKPQAGSFHLLDLLKQTN